MCSSLQNIARKIQTNSFSVVAHTTVRDVVLVLYHNYCCQKMAAPPVFLVLCQRQPTATTRHALATAAGSRLTASRTVPLQSLEPARRLNDTRNSCFKQVPHDREASTNGRAVFAGCHGNVGVYPRLTEQSRSPACVSV